MSGAHDEKLIAEKYAIDYPRRPLATRLWKRRWNWLAFFAACLVGVALYFVQGNAGFWAGPVSHSHASFAMDCQKCHAESWQPALRLASLDSGRHSVPDAACRQCHPTVGDHHLRGGKIEPACASCHQEHRREKPLLEVADSHCASCHGSAAALYGGPGVESHFQAEIVTFNDGLQGHPDFAFFFGGPVSEVHGAFRVAAPDNDGKWHDTGGILFNHKVHLAAEGVLDANRKPVKLTCANCHQEDGDGRYMRPIVYEHCASCHPLRLAGELAMLGDLPHENPEVVRGVIRERLAQPKSKPDRAAPLSAIRRLPQPSTLTQTANSDALLAAADHAVFGLEAKGLCRKCHHVEISDGRWNVPLVNPEFGEIATDTSREMIPSRWFAHGQFHHAKHLSVECEQCHRASESSKTSDLLLPGIADCRKCHGSNPTTIATGVSAECVLCHDYHGPAKQQPTETALLTFFKGAAAP